MRLFGPSHPSPIRIKCSTVEGFLLAYDKNSSLKNVQTFLPVETIVKKALNRGQRKHKPVKLWKLNLKNSDITSNQLTALAETLVTHPVISHLDLRNNFIGDKGAVVLLQAMRCQYDAVMDASAHRGAAGEYPDAYNADCNILHKVDLEGSGVNMQDESTLLNTLEEHERVMKDVHRWVEIQYVFLKHSEFIEGKGNMIHSKSLKAACSKLRLSSRTIEKAKNECVNGHMDLELFRKTVAPDYLECRGTRPPLLPRIEGRRLSIATREMMLGQLQNTDVGGRNLSPMHQEKRFNNALRVGVDDNRGNNELGSSQLGSMVGNGQFGDSSGLRGHSNGKWGNAINDDPIRGTNGLTVDLGGNDQKLRDEEPKVEPPSPWSSSFNSFQSSLATAPRGRKHSMTRSTFYAPDSSGGD